MQVCTKNSPFWNKKCKKKFSRGDTPARPHNPWHLNMAFIPPMVLKLSVTPSPKTWA